MGVLLALAQAAANTVGNKFNPLWKNPGHRFGGVLVLVLLAVTFVLGVLVRRRRWCVCVCVLAATFVLGVLVRRRRWCVCVCVCLGGWG